jgi:hypothetical protein
MTDEKQRIERAKRAESVTAFLEQVATLPVPGHRGRLIFAIDATASREPTWDQASHLQVEMFQVTEKLAGLEVQLVHYRGHREFQASGWLAESSALAQRMTAVRCRGGLTQIERVLRHAAQESTAGRVSALVFVGDCVEESPTQLYHAAAELALRGTPAFMFLEGHDGNAQSCFAEIARITRGAFCRFDSGSAAQLRQLLTAVAVYASGGRDALQRLTDGGDSLMRRLAHQLQGD